MDGGGTHPTPHLDLGNLDSKSWCTPTILAPSHPLFHPRNWMAATTTVAKAIDPRLQTEVFLEERCMGELGMCSRTPPAQ